MPYIGRNHIAGDHTSNFKVLDDISSYTATFNGSSASIVSTADNTIRVPEHRFIQGQRVTYSNGGGGNIGGLTNGTAYFVTFDTANTFKLATSLANANNNTNINLSSVGTGSAHTLTAAFDGVNTTFKLTHGGGTSADIVNSAQLQIAINNVIQKANQDSTYTEGFRVVDSRKIQFKTAPTVDDVFWGNIIANTIETFDLADLKVDNFTGNGTTTQFTLSRAVPNNESIMVTIDGVLQHPSDKDTTRAYRVLSDSVIEFSSPPPNHGNIQVRHLGFAGASTGDVSGFYGRTGNVVLGASDHITTGDITPRNINASGIVTASSFSGGFSGNIVGTSATFTGNLSVGGVLTYEDVTNVDSVGIITAQKDIHVGAGLSVVGVSTLGTSGSVFLQHNGTTRLNTTSNGILINGAANLENSGSNIIVGGLGINQTIFHRGDENTAMDFSDNDRVRFRTGGVERLAITNDGVHINVGVTTIAQELDVDGHTNLDNVSVAGVSTFAGDIVIPDSIVHSGDTDTKIRFPQDNNITLETSGSQRLRVDSLGRIGISQPSPQYKLDILETTNTRALNIKYGTSTNTTSGVQIRNSSDAGNLYLGVWGPSSGSYGQVNANDAFIGSSDDWSIHSVSNTGVIKFGIGSSGPVEKMRITSTGVDISNDLDVDGHTNLDNVSIAGVVTATTYYGDGSNLSNITSTTINNNADNRVITGSGTANTLNGESSLTYNGSSFKIGDTSFSNVNTGAENLIIGTESSGSNRGLSIITHSANTGHLFFGDQDNGTMGGFRYQNGADVLQGYSGGSAPFYLKSNALGLHENYPEAHSITIRGASQNDIPLLVIRKHTDGDTNHDEEIGRIKFKSNDNNVDSGNSVSRVELRAVHVNAAGAAKLEFYTVPNFTTNPVKTMTLNQEGRLCIGTDDAVAKLNVVHSSSDTTATGSGTLASCISVSNTNTTNNNFAGIVFGDRTDSQDFIGGIFTQITDHTQNYGNLVFYTNGSGGRTEKLRIAADGKVGMGAQTNPQGQLDIRTTNDDDAIRLVNTSTGNNGIQWWNEYGGLTKRVSMDYGEGDANFDIRCFRADAQDNRPYGNVRIMTGSYSDPQTNFRVTTLGSVHCPNQPSFAASRTGGDVTNAVAVFNSVKFNVGSNYNNTNGRFTAPIAGKYQFSFAGMAYGASADFQARLRKNGSNYFNNNGSGRGYGTFEPYGFTVLIDLAKDDYVEIYVYSSNSSAKFYMTGATWNIFSGYLVG